ncbi:MAG: nucleoside-diphosphate kinase [Nitrospirales bacterium]|jgi:nucleoside-diphosphate kinase
MLERTLAIVKPDAVAKHVIGDIVRRYEEAGLLPIAMRMLHLSKASAEGFYAVHRERPFFNDLTTYMCSGPVVVVVLEGKDAVKTHRDLMGATDPKQAAPGTIRALYGASIEANAVHGSDSPENAQIEIRYFFPESELR